MSNQSTEKNKTPYEIVGIHHGKVVRGGKKAPLTATTKEEAYKIFKSVLSEFRRVLNINTILDDDWSHTENGDFLQIASKEYDCAVKIIPVKN